MNIKFSETYDFNLTLSTKYCILNQHKVGCYTQIYSKVLIRTNDLLTLITIRPGQSSNLKPSPYLNPLHQCQVKFKQKCKLIQLKPNLKLEGNTKSIKRRTKRVLHTSQDYITFTPIEQMNLGYQPLRTFLVPQDIASEAIKDIRRDLFLHKI